MNYIFKFKLRTINILNDIKKFHQNGLLKSQNLSEEKKHPSTFVTSFPLLSLQKSEQSKHSRLMQSMHFENT